jgi:hypothetical protein
MALVNRKVRLRTQPATKLIVGGRPCGADKNGTTTGPCWFHDPWWMRAATGADVRPGQLVADSCAGSRGAVADGRLARAVQVGWRDLVLTRERPGDQRIVPGRPDLEPINAEELAADRPVRELGGVDVHVVLARVATMASANAGSRSAQPPARSIGAGT